MPSFDSGDYSILLQKDTIAKYWFKKASRTYFSYRCEHIKQTGISHIKSGEFLAVWVQL